MLICSGIRSVAWIPYGQDPIVAAMDVCYNADLPPGPLTYVVVPGFRRQGQEVMGGSRGE